MNGESTTSPGVAPHDERALDHVELQRAQMALVVGSRAPER
jgi:hypothetical protein